MGGCTRIERFKTPIDILLFLLTSFAGLSGCRDSGFPDHAAAQTQPSQSRAFNLGRIWRVEEGYYNEPHWFGVWTRRGQTYIFDATWKHSWMDETTKDLLEVQLAKDGQVVVFRQGVKQCYRGTYSDQHPNKLRGRADWFGPDLIWKADIEY